MKTASRKITIGIKIIHIDKLTETIVIEPYTIIDGDTLSQKGVWIQEEDTLEFTYINDITYGRSVKAVDFTDTIDLGDRQWVAKRKVNS